MCEISNCVRGKEEGRIDMPKGSPSKQTIASEKYQKKAGYVAKAFKLKKDIVEEFEKACEKDGVAQSAKITEFMKKYIEEKNMQKK